MHYVNGHVLDRDAVCAASMLKATIEKMFDLTVFRSIEMNDIHTGISVFIHRGKYAVVCRIRGQSITLTCNIPLIHDFSMVIVFDNRAICTTRRTFLSF